MEIKILFHLNISLEIVFFFCFFFHLKTPNKMQIGKMNRKIQNRNEFMIFIWKNCARAQAHSKHDTMLLMTKFRSQLLQMESLFLLFTRNVHLHLSILFFSVSILYCSSYANVMISISSEKKIIILSIEKHIDRWKFSFFNIHNVNLTWQFAMKTIH